MQKAVLRNFANFTRKHLCWALFLIKLQANTGETPTQAFSSKICKIFKNTYSKNICERLFLPITYSCKFLKHFIIFLPNFCICRGEGLKQKGYHDSQMANRQTWLLVCNFAQIIHFFKMLFVNVIRFYTWLVNVFVYVCFFFLKLMLLKCSKRTNVQKSFTKNQVLMCSDLHKKYRRYRLDHTIV